MEPNISGMTPEAKTGNDTVLSDNLNGASPSMQDGFAGMTADPQKLFQHTVDLYMQFADMMKYAEPKTILDSSDKAASEFFDSVIYALKRLRSRTKPQSADDTSRVTDDVKYDPSFAKKLNEIGQSAIAAIMSAAKSHSYDTSDMADGNIRKIIAQYGGRIRSIEGSLRPVLRFAVDGIAQVESIAWAIVGRDIFADAIDRILEGGVGRAEALAIATDTHYSNFPDDSTAEDTVEVPVEKINDLTKFGIRHFYMMFGPTNKLYSKTANYFPYLIKACMTGYAPIMTSAITAIYPTFFSRVPAQNDPATNKPVSNAGKIVGMTLLPQVVEKIFDGAVRNICTDLVRAIEARSELIEAVGTLENDAVMKTILNTFLGVNTRESGSVPTVTITTDAGEFQIETTQFEAGTVGGSSLNRGRQTGYMRNSGIASSKNIENNGVERDANGARVNLTVYGVDVVLPIDNSSALDNYTLPRLIEGAFHGVKEGAWIVCQGLAPFSYVGEEGLQQDAALVEPGMPDRNVADSQGAYDFAASLHPNVAGKKTDSYLKHVGKIAGQLQTMNPALVMDDAVQNVIVKTIREAAASNPQFTHEVSIALGVVNQVQSAYKAFRHDVAEAILPGSRAKSGPRVITTGKMKHVIGQVSQAIIIDMLSGNADDDDELTIRDKTMQDVKSALLSSWAKGANYDLKAMGFDTQDKNLSQVTALMFGRNGAVGISREIIAEVSPDGKNFAEQFDVETHRNEVRLLLTRYAHALSIVGDDVFPDNIRDALIDAASGDHDACVKLIEGSTGWFGDNYAQDVYASARQNFDDWSLENSYDTLDESNPAFRNVIGAINRFYDLVANAMFSKYDGVVGRDAVRDVVSSVNGVVNNIDTSAASADPSDMSATEIAKLAVSNVTDFYTLSKLIDLVGEAVAPHQLQAPMKVKSGSGFVRDSEDAPDTVARKPLDSEAEYEGNTDVFFGYDHDTDPVNNIAAPETQIAFSDVVTGNDREQASLYGLDKLQDLVQRDDTHKDMIVSAIDHYDYARENLAKLQQLGNSATNPVSENALIQYSTKNVACKLISIFGDALTKGGNSKERTETIRRSYEAADAYLSDMSNTARFNLMGLAHTIIAQEYNNTFGAAGENKVRSMVQAHMGNANDPNAADAMFYDIMAYRAALSVCNVINTLWDDIGEASNNALDYKKFSANALKLTPTKKSRRSVIDMKNTVSEVDNTSGANDDIVDSYARLIISPKANKPYVKSSSNITGATTSGIQASLIAYNRAIHQRLETDANLRNLAAMIGNELGVTINEEKSLDTTKKEVIGKMYRSTLTTNPVKAFTGIAGNGIKSAIVNSIFDDERANDRTYSTTKNTIKGLLSGGQVNVYSKNLGVNELTNIEWGDYNTKVARPVAYDAAGNVSETGTPIPMEAIAEKCGVSGEYGRAPDRSEFSDDASFNSAMASFDSDLTNFIMDVRDQVARQVIKLAVDAGFVADKTYKKRRANQDDNAVYNTICDQLLPLLDSNQLSLAELIIVMNPDSELYADYSAHLHSGTQVYPVSRFNDDGTVKPMSATRDTPFVQERKKKIFDILSGLPANVGKKTLYALGVKYFTEPGLRDEIAHDYPRIASVFEQLTGLELLDKTNAFNDFWRIFEEFAETRESQQGLEGKYSAIKAITDEPPANMTPAQRNAWLNETRTKAESDFPGIGKLFAEAKHLACMHFGVSDPTQLFAGKTLSADEKKKLITAYRNTVASILRRMVDDARKPVVSNVNMANIDSAIDLACSFPPSFGKADNWGKYIDANVKKAAEIYPPIEQLFADASASACKSLHAPDQDTLMETLKGKPIDEARSVLAKYLGACREKLTKQAPAFAEKSRTASTAHPDAYMPNEHSEEFSTMEALTERDAIDQVISSLGKFGIDVKLVDKTTNPNNPYFEYSITADGQNTVVAPSIFDDVCKLTMLDMKRDGRNCDVHTSFMEHLAKKKPKFKPVEAKKPTPPPPKEPVDPAKKAEAEQATANQPQFAKLVDQYYEKLLDIARKNDAEMQKKAELDHTISYVPKFDSAGNLLDTGIIAKLRTEARRLAQLKMNPGAK